MMLSVVMPARDEAQTVAETVTDLHRALAAEGVEHELVVINDGSGDETASVLDALVSDVPTLSWHDNAFPNGFGFAIRYGFTQARGEVLAVVMADGSDAPDDLVRCYRTLVDEEVDCVFGSRFIDGAEVIDYPRLKLLLNRLANLFIRVLFRITLNDTTNAFKLYRRRVIEGLQPLLSHDFNLTVELPLKAIIRGYSHAVIPISWRNRRHGESKLKIREMGSRYLFIVLYCFIEKLLVVKDYDKESERMMRSMERE